MPATTTEVKFNCASCRREYRWKPELAGKQAKCKCGNVMTVPSTPPPPPPPGAGPRPAPAKQEEPSIGLDGLYALAAEEKRAGAMMAAAPPELKQGYRCPSCGTALPLGATVCPNCNLNMKTGRRPAAQGDRAGGVEAAMRGFVLKKGAGAGGKALPMKGGGKYAKAAVVKPQGFTDFSMPRDIYLPLGLIGLGLVMYFVQLKFFMDAELAESLGRMFLLVIIAGDVVVMFIAMLISLKFLGDTPGGLGTTALKFGAIALAPGSLGEIVTIMVGKSNDTAGFVVGGLLTLVLYAVLVKVLFNLDGNTTGKIVGTIYIVRVWGRRILFIGLVAVFAIMLVRGASKHGGADSGDEDAPRAKPATPEEKRKEFDSEAQDALKDDGATEARAWARASGHGVFNLGNETLPTIDSLYKMGAKKVTVSGFADDAKAIGTVLVIELPADPAAREPLFTWAEAQEKKLNPEEPDPPKDVGQKYIVVNFDNS